MKALLDYFHPLERAKRQRKQYLGNVRLPKVLAHLVHEPTPDASDFGCKQNYIVLDLETTGFDYNQDLILSMGWVEVKDGKIDLASARHVYIDSDSQVRPETAVINHITPQMLSEEGVSINSAMTAFFEAAANKILVAHACVMEENFINHYLHANFGYQHLPLLWIDTMCIEKRLAQGINQQDETDVTLSATRERYGLPEYNNHNALIDAVATAELLLAQQKRINPNNKATIGQLYRLSH
ncbi:3'-5' exonuclease [Vibrio sp. SCSIO 43136]|uniref:3'-5' exonuclease n=1 Tax=Vibrio sp. SCSIO 43136 TaxID=2819101 RepID=UPI002075599A|nr:3'-5' exonuclease [Vibrio sp. SCSIO 43136]USD67335.1 3'-5' exonuclease [Vibrio sp. SCSIO 43136]